MGRRHDVRLCGDLFSLIIALMGMGINGDGVQAVQMSAEVRLKFDVSEACLSSLTYSGSVRLRSWPALRRIQVPLEMLLLCPIQIRFVYNSLTTIGVEGR